MASSSSECTPPQDLLLHTALRKDSSNPGKSSEWPHRARIHLEVCRPGCMTGSCLSVQFSSVAQSCLTLCDPMDCSTPGLPVHHQPGLPVHHQLPEFTQSHVRRVGDTIQPSHPLTSPPYAFNLSQHQGLLKRVSSSHQVANVLAFQLQHQSFQ